MLYDECDHLFTAGLHDDETPPQVNMRNPPHINHKHQGLSLHVWMSSHASGGNYPLYQCVYSTQRKTHTITISLLVRFHLPDDQTEKIHFTALIG